MGDARRRMLRGELLPRGGFAAVPMTAKQGVVLMQLDVLCHVLEQQAKVFEHLGAVAESGLLGKCFELIQKHKGDFLREQAKQVVLAQPGDVPRP